MNNATLVSPLKHLKVNVRLREMFVTYYRCTVEMCWWKRTILARPTRAAWLGYYEEFRRVVDLHQLSCRKLTSLILTIRSVME